MLDFTFTHVKKLEQGKQGITGLVKSEDGTLYVYKMSQFMNYLPDHEFTILSGLNELSDRCPHYCKVVGKTTYPIHPNFIAEQQDPFEPHKNPLYLDVLFLEYIPDSISLFDFIKNSAVPTKQIVSCVKQILTAIQIAQKYKRFVHYDLHSMNVLMKKTDADVYLYLPSQSKEDENDPICIPTYGNNCTIIDYGFSASIDTNNKPSCISLAFTESGYMAPAFDTFADAKIFLVSLLEDFKEVSDLRPPQGEIRKIRNIVTNIFSPLKIDWQSGWDMYDEPSIMDQLFDYIEDTEEESPLFREFPQVCMDILQSLVILPLQPMECSLKELKRSYLALVAEFHKIELEVNNPFFTFYILRNVVDIAHQVRSDYMNPPSRETAVQYFKNQVFTAVNTIVKFCSLKEVHYERLLCSLFVFADQLKGKLYYLLCKKLDRKEREYRRLPVRSIEEIFTIFDVTMKDDYIYTNKTIVRVFEPGRPPTDIQLSANIAKIMNATPAFLRGQTLKSLYLSSSSKKTTTPKTVSPSPPSPPPPSPPPPSPSSLSDSESSFLSGSSLSGSSFSDSVGPSSESDIETLL
jgi:hypothetical protein